MECRLECGTQNITIVSAAHKSHAAITESVILPIAYNNHLVLLAFHAMSKTFTTLATLILTVKSRAVDVLLFNF